MCTGRACNRTTRHRQTLSLLLLYWAQCFQWTLKPCTQNHFFLDKFYFQLCTKQVFLASFLGLYRTTFVLSIFFCHIFLQPYTKKRFFAQKEADNADITSIVNYCCAKNKNNLSKKKCNVHGAYQPKLAEACLVYTQSLFKHLSHYTDRYQYQYLCSWKLVQYHLSHPTMNREDRFHS